MYASSDSVAKSISGGQAIPVPDGLGLLVNRHAWAEDPRREIGSMRVSPDDKADARPGGPPMRHPMRQNADRRSRLHPGSMAVAFSHARAYNGARFGKLLDSVIFSGHGGPGPRSRVERV